MTMIKIPKTEIGTTRVFSLSMDAAEARRLRDDPAKQAQALGAPPQNPDGIEVFALADLGDLGLAGFLRDGVDAHPDDIARDKAKLAALDGWVLLVHSTAFSKEGATLAPLPALTLIGTYAQTPADQTQLPLTAEAAKPYTGTPTTTTPPATTNARGSWVFVTLLLIACAVIWWALR